MKPPLRTKTEDKIAPSRIGIPEAIGASVLVFVLGSVIYALLKTQVPGLF